MDSWPQETSNGATPQAAAAFGAKEDVASVLNHPHHHHDTALEASKTSVDRVHEGGAATVGAESGVAAGDTAMEEDLLPDLGLSAEDMKFVDLEFLDLASAPPNTEKSRNKLG
jgi:hypothetical protein